MNENEVCLVCVCDHFTRIRILYIVNNTEYGVILKQICNIKLLFVNMSILEVAKYQLCGDTHSIKFLNHCHGSRFLADRFTWLQFYLFHLYIHSLSSKYTHLKRISVTDIFALFDITVHYSTPHYSALHFTTLHKLTETPPWGKTETFLTRKEYMLSCNQNYDVRLLYKSFQNSFYYNDHCCFVG